MYIYIYMYVYTQPKGPIVFANNPYVKACGLKVGVMVRAEDSPQHLANCRLSNVNGILI